MSIESIKLDHLRYFVAAVETGSFAAAGERLNITPTSIAHGVSAIEEALCTDLLIRKRAAGVIPNPKGKRFLTACRKVLLEVERIGEEFKPVPGEIVGELIVGCQEGLTWSVAPRAIEEMRKRHPGVKVSVKTIFMGDELTPLEAGEVDLVLTFRYQKAQPDLAAKLEAGHYFSQVLCRPQTYAMLDYDHPLCATGRSTVSLQDLAEYPHIFIDDGAAFPFFLGMYHDAGLEPEIAMVSNISPSAQSVVGKSEAVSLRIVRPSINLSPLGDKLAFLELSNQVARPDLVAITLRNSQSNISRRADRFIKICQEKFDDGTLKQNFFY